MKVQPKWSFGGACVLNISSDSLKLDNTRWLTNEKMQTRTPISLKDELRLYQDQQHHVYNVSYF